MLWHGPIWLNETLVSIIKLLVGIFTCINIISPVVISWSFIYIIRRKIKLIEFIKDTKTLMLLACFTVSVVGVIVFYYPQDVLPDKYDFIEIQISDENRFATENSLTITDKKALNEFRNILLGYKCRRSYDTGETALDSEVIFIDTIVRVGDKTTPLHFIFEQGQQRRYTGGNVDFIYVVENEDNNLYNKIHEYVSKYKTK
jgi:hypothetical protein